MKLLRFAALFAGFSSVQAQSSLESDQTRVEIERMKQSATQFEKLQMFMPNYETYEELGIVALGMIYDWDALWNKEASEE